ncbi:MAG: DUF5660 family protein [Patescibacteria group bacterium]
MTSQNNQDSKKQNRVNRNFIETLEEDKQTTVSSTSQLKKMGSGVLEQFFGQNLEGYQKKEAKKRPTKQEFKLFDKKEYNESENTASQIKELMNQIKQEIEAIKKADSALISQVQEAEKLAVENVSENQGVYNVRFLQLVVSFLRTLRLKIGESSTWFEALKTKRKKRGSLFANLSKKKGTQYSLSQELQSSRSVQ